MRTLAAVLLCVAAPRLVLAQIPLLEKVFEEIEDVSTTGGPALLLDEKGVSADALMGIVFEVSFEMAEMGCIETDPAAKAAALCKSKMSRAEAEDSTRVRCAIKGDEARNDSDCQELEAGDEWEPAERVVESKEGDQKVTTKYTHTEPEDGGTTPRAIAEFGLSYGQYTDFRAPEGSALDIGGRVEELPAIATYISFNPANRVSPYIGARGGLIRLAGFRAYDANDVLFKADGSSYLIGVVAGAAIQFTDGVFGLLQLDATYRNFPTVEWEATEEGVVPDELPRSLPFSTAGLQLGLQINVN